MNKSRPEMDENGRKKIFVFNDALEIILKFWHLILNVLSLRNSHIENFGKRYFYKLIEIYFK
jgi:hypothetical protein